MFVQVAVREDAWCTGREVRVVACADDGLALFLHLMRALIPHVRVAVGAERRPDFVRFLACAS